ncbi:hypothetical protein BDW42DRAFT_7294 [Aspergillus taichungensis]|uniref:Asl1-like glycosyl hydrolase catalytic domain-containing protein n=1 Tax=Aspergillus taichungensis TaxID=482145 RepID=A0A2J5HJM6_9EURO|nr:hypothetical protein BDW42DRAFT_7294 [Aspergillus taichungensis]
MVAITKIVATALAATSALALPHGTGHSHTQTRSVTAGKRSTANKKGAAYNDASMVKSLAGGTSNASKISWAYDWNMHSMGILPSDVEFVPMLWGSKMFGEWFNTIQTVLFSGSNYIMGFNEPDLPSQAAMSPSEAAEHYKKYISPFNGKAKLVTPAVSSTEGDNTGLGWMRQFLDQCTDCGMSVLAVHWYGDDAAAFKDFVSRAESLASEYNLEETWVTEFALTSDLSAGGGNEQSTQFLGEVLPWLDAEPGVGRYAYFMCADGYLLSGDQLSTSGQAYLG